MISNSINSSYTITNNVDTPCPCDNCMKKDVCMYRKEAEKTVEEILKTLNKICKSDIFELSKPIITCKYFQKDYTTITYPGWNDGGVIYTDRTNNSSL